MPCIVEITSDSDEELFSDDEYDGLENLNDDKPTVWKDLELRNYDLRYDLHKCKFLIDLLSPFYILELDKSEIIIKKKDTKKIVKKENIIYFLQVEIYNIFKKEKITLNNNLYSKITIYFNKVSKIYDVLHFMKIYLECLPTHSE